MSKHSPLHKKHCSSRKDSEELEGVKRRRPLALSSNTNEYAVAKKVGPHFFFCSGEAVLPVPLSPVSVPGAAARALLAAAVAPVIVVIVSSSFFLAEDLILCVRRAKKGKVTNGNRIRAAPIWLADH